MNLISIISGQVDANNAAVKNLIIEVEDNGVVEQLNFALHPDDPYGLAPSVRQALEDNPIILGAAPLPDIALIKLDAKRRVVEFADDLTELVKNSPNGGVPYPAGEQAKWTQKEAEARAYEAIAAANGTIVETDYPYLWKLCGQDSSALATLATNVLYHADRFEDAAVLIEQLRTQTFAAIESCSDQDQINAVLEAAKATALASVEALLAP